MERTISDDEDNSKAELGHEPATGTGRPGFARAIAAGVPLGAATIAAFAPVGESSKLELVYWLSIFCLAYLPIVTLWDCIGQKHGVWKAIARTLASIGAMVAGAVAGIAFHLLFHRMIYLDALAVSVLAGAAVALSVSIYFPWLGDACMTVVDFFVAGV